MRSSAWRSAGRLLQCSAPHSVAVQRAGVASQATLDDLASISRLPSIEREAAGRPPREGARRRGSGCCVAASRMRRRRSHPGRRAGDLARDAASAAVPVPPEGLCRTLGDGGPGLKRESRTARRTLRVGPCAGAPVHRDNVPGQGGPEVPVGGWFGVVRSGLASEVSAPRTPPGGRARPADPSVRSPVGSDSRRSRTVSRGGEARPRPRPDPPPSRRSTRPGR